MDTSRAVRYAAFLAQSVKLNVEMVFARRQRQTTLIPENLFFDAVQTLLVQRVVQRFFLRKNQLLSMA